MMGRTHLMIGVAGSIDLAILTHTPIGFAGIATAAVCSILPDIDEPNSMISHRTGGKIGITVIAAAAAVFGFLGGYIPLGVFAILLGIAPHLRHRKFTHTVFAAAIIWLFLAWLGAKTGVGDLALFGTSAYVLHILADVITNTGVPVLYPLIKKKLSFHVTNTGDGPEYFIALIPIVILILVAFTNQHLFAI